MEPEEVKLRLIYSILGHCPVLPTPSPPDIQQPRVFSRDSKTRKTVQTHPRWGWEAFGKGVWVVWCVLLLLGFSSEAQARCGSSSRQMLWRNSTNAELIRLDAAVFVPTAGPRIDSQATVDSGMSHQDDRPCSTCRCRNEKEPGVPLESLATESTSSPVCRSNDRLEAVLLELMNSSIADLCDAFLGPSLGLLERPPKGCCG